MKVSYREVFWINSKPLFLNFFKYKPNICEAVLLRDYDPPTNEHVPAKYTSHRSKESPHYPPITKYFNLLNQLNKQISSTNKQ